MRIGMYVRARNVTFSFCVMGVGVWVAQFKMKFLFLVSPYSPLDDVSSPSLRSCVAMLINIVQWEQKFFSLFFFSLFSLCLAPF